MYKYCLYIALCLESIGSTSVCILWKFIIKPSRLVIIPIGDGTWLASHAYQIINLRSICLKECFNWIPVPFIVLKDRRVTCWSHMQIYIWQCSWIWRLNKAILQQPCAKTAISVTLEEKEGCGKWEAIGSSIGKHCRIENQ